MGKTPRKVGVEYYLTTPQNVGGVPTIPPPTAIGKKIRLPTRGIGKLSGPPTRGIF